MGFEFLAARSVACPKPKCKAKPGERCRSTGGGNFAYVGPHAPRVERIEDWTQFQIDGAVELVRAQGSRQWYELPAGYYDVTEAAAKPIEEPTAKQLTPRGVRLSEAQAERIELAAQAGGTYYVSTAHFHGDATDRAVIDALQSKGILRDAGLAGGGYERVMELTAFGWQVYRQHRLVIRRLDDAAAAEYEHEAREHEARELEREGAR